MSPDGKLFVVLSRFWSNWPVWGGILTILLLAKHFWVLFAPAEYDLPRNTTVPAAARTGLLFGVAESSGKTTATLDGIRPVGIFAHSTRGFAVMETPSGQVGVGLGSEVAPGIRLVETHADHVMLERSGSMHRVDLSTATVSNGILSAPATTTHPASPTNSMSTYDDTLSQLPPAQRALIRQSQPDILRGRP